jgi:hypothetical protein
MTYDREGSTRPGREIVEDKTEWEIVRTEWRARASSDEGMEFEPEELRPGVPKILAELGGFLAKLRADNDHIIYLALIEQLAWYVIDGGFYPAEKTAMTSRLFKKAVDRVLWMRLNGHGYYTGQRKKDDLMPRPTPAMAGGPPPDPTNPLCTKCQGRTIRSGFSIKRIRAE